MGSEDTNPYRYSDGRWLRNDAAHQEARHISFDFDALCRRVVQSCLGAHSVSTYEKKDGGFNRVFIFTTDNEKVIVAKLPFSNAGPRHLTTKSEIATIKFLRKYSKLPVPTIYDWSDDRDNEVGSEYIIMEHAPGVSLHIRWISMTKIQQVQCINNICRLLGSIDNICFPAYGSLYTTDHDVGSTIKLGSDSQFCVGPHVATRYWDCNVGDHRYYSGIPPNRGPWRDLPEWADGLADVGCSRVPPHDSDHGLRPRYFGTPEMHLQLLLDGRSLLRTISTDRRLSAVAQPVLSHPDLNKRNIFVDNDDPTKVVSFIDWQSAGVDPAFWVVATRPDFAALPDQPEDSSGDGTMVCAKSFDASLASYSPRLARAQCLDSRLVRPFEYIHRTWNDGAVAFRHDLMMTTKEWKDIGFEAQCPIAEPDPYEVSAHESEYRHFVAAQKLRKQVTDYLTVSSDGWVPKEAWDTVQVQHQELYHGAVQAILSAENSNSDEIIKTEQDLKAIWPFDL